MNIKFAGLFFLLSLICHVVMADSLKTQVLPEKHTRGVIWKIDGANIEPSYLMGTMHVDDPGIRLLFTHAQKYFDDAKMVCTEIKMDFAAIAAEIQAMFFSDGQTLKSVIADQRFYQQVIQAAEKHGLPEAAVRNMKPFTLAFMLSMPVSKGKCSIVKFIPMH